MTKPKTNPRPNRLAAYPAILAVLMTVLGAPALKAAVSQTPLITGSGLPPRVMLVMSRDHQLYIEAYTDYTDLDGDGTLDTTYTDSFDYYGYFDSSKCYSYSGGRFVPTGAAGGPNGHHCAAWSGNFLNWATMTRMDVLRKVLYGGYRSTDTDTTTVLERVLLPNDTHAFSKVFRSSDMASYTPYSNGTITMCNVTFLSSGESQNVDTASNPPSLRIAQGAWPAWAANEVVQCQWDRNNLSPAESSDKLGELNVRVEVCSSAPLEDNCKRYPDGDKPVGLLQNYGENGGLLFGLLTGSYAQNKSGGVLRRNIGQIGGNEPPNQNLDEIDPDSGRFINQGAGTEGIINTINRLGISHWDYSSHAYVDSCNSPGILSFSNGECSNWGNPLSETYFETLRYFAGADTPQYNADDTSYIPGLPTAGSWEDPTSEAQYCAANSIVVLSTAATSFDAGDEAEYTGTSDLANFPGVNSATNTVGAGEGISGDYFYGGSNGQCTGKSLAGLSGAVGLCPEVPSLEGGYGIAGLAWYARTADIRTDRDDDQTVETFAFNLAESLPKIEIGGVNVIPACEANSNGGADASSSGWRTCSLIQFSVADLNRNASGELTSGTFFAFWEDSTWGNDYDMDGIVQMDVCLGSACNDPAVGSNEIGVRVEAVQAFAGHALRFGYTISGSDDDGIKLPVLRPGGQNFSVFGGNSDNPGNQPPPDLAAYQRGSSAAEYLENPLWYAAKWGGFSDQNDNDEPDQVQEWDSDGDGRPDNYFPIRDPGELESSLDKVFGDIAAQTGSTAAATTNTGIAVQGGTTVYQPLYRSGDWSGDVLAFAFDDGALADTPFARASDGLDLQNWDTGREILTLMPGQSNQAPTGIPFRWDELAPSQQAALDESDGEGEARLEYLRGSDDNEGSGNGYRIRSTVLGDVVDSTPTYVGAPRNKYFDLPGTEGSSYLTYVEDKEDRQAMVYVGANDGMLHAFNAETLTESFAYVPLTIYPELSRLTNPDYGHHFYVNGSPTAGDAYLNGAWRTVVVGTTGAGGRSVFALDVTEPTGISESNASSTVMWEINPSLDPDYADLGYTFSRPAIVRMANGQWAAVFGNGYESASGKAVLYIADLSDGSLIEAIELAGGPANGLSTPIAVDVNDDRIVDRIYAGDLKGNLWKVDVSDSQSNQWTSAFGNQSNPDPLFTATSPGGGEQAITVRPEVVAHPTAGQVILFGTGQFFETGDNVVDQNTTTQSFYGIWDSETTAQSGNAGRGDLQAQEIETEAEFQGRPVRVTSDNAVNFDVDDPDSGDLGWVLDLDHPTVPNGERVVRNPTVRAGKVIFPTLIPSGELCEGGGTGWLMEMDAITGARLPYSPFDLDDNEVFDEDDYVEVPDGNGGTEEVPASGIQPSNGIPSQPAIVMDPEGDKEYKFITGSDGSTEMVPNNPGPQAFGRQSWRQIR